MSEGARAGESRESGVRSAAWLLAAILIPNIVLLACGQFLFLQRAWVNVDYVLLGLAGLALRRRPLWLPALIVAVFVVDVLFAFAPAYHFTPSSLLRAATAVFQLGFGVIALNACILVAAAALVAWGMTRTIRLVSRPLPAAVAALIFGVTVGVLDPAVSKSTIRFGGQSLTIPNLAFSTSLNTAIAVRTSADPGARLPSAGDVDSAGDAFRSMIDTGDPRPPFLFLVNVESLGLFRSKALNNHQLAPLLALDDHPHWRVSAKRIAFEGFTVAGELRELCDIRYPTVSPVIDEQLSADCLPRQLGELGYETAAFHGFQGTFFERNHWYRKLGFNDVFFGGGMQARFEGLERCGSAFEGICDRSAWRAIIEYASRAPKPVFIYWMTLTAHLPVIQHPQPEVSDACPGAVEAYPEICSHLAWHRSLFRTIAGRLRRGELDGARFLLVGDHSPPFLDSKLRNLFSPRHVPVVDIRYTGPQPPKGDR